MKQKSPSSKEKPPHTSVMLDEVLEGFKGVHLKVFYEGTIGAGGHAKAILQEHPEIELYIGCDKDPDALVLAEKHLAPWGKKIELIQGNFADLDFHLKERGIKSVEGFFLI